MIATNEQSVVAATDRIVVLKKEYMDSLSEFWRSDNEPREERLGKVLLCQQNASRLFNYIEDFVGNSDLLGAHRRGLWITGFAESCYAFLDSLAKHTAFLRSRVSEFPEIAPGLEMSPTAYANMQRMVVKYLSPDKVHRIKKLFIDNDLPVEGFNVAAADNEVPAWQAKLGVILGIIMVGIAFATSFMVPHPSKFQEFIWRVMFSFGLAALSPLIPGFVSLASRIGGKYGYVVIAAGSGSAIFLFVYLVEIARF